MLPEEAINLIPAQSGVPKTRSHTRIHTGSPTCISEIKIMRWA